MENNKNDTNQPKNTKNPSGTTTNTEMKILPAKDFNHKLDNFFLGFADLRKNKEDMRKQDEIQHHVNKISSSLYSLFAPLHGSDKP